MGSHVTPQVLGRPEPPHAECTLHLVQIKADLSYKKKVHRIQLGAMDS